MGSARDTKLFDTCDPWYGDKESFEDVFVPDFMTGLGRHHDDYCTQRAHLLGNDSPGSIIPTTDAQRAAHNDHVNNIQAHQGFAADVRRSAAASRMV